MAVAELEEFGRDVEWTLKHYAEFLEKYEGEWIAVYRCRVVGHGDDLGKLVQSLVVRGLKPERMVMRYVSKEPLEAIL